MVTLRRMALDMTQTELGDRIGMTQAHVSKIERGETTRPEKETLDQLALGLRMPAWRLYVAAYEGSEVEPAAIPVRYFGTVPMDAVRWVAAQEGAEMRSVLPEWLGTRSPDDCFVVDASGDCLFQSHGIASGFSVLCEWVDASGESVRDGDVVVVRIADECTMKRWFRVGDNVELRDGEDRVVHRISRGDDGVTVLGRYLTHWKPVSG